MEDYTSVGKQKNNEAYCINLSGKRFVDAVCFKLIFHAVQRRTKPFVIHNICYYHITKVQYFFNSQHGYYFNISVLKYQM